MEGTSLVVQWLRIHLSTHGTRVRSRSRKIPHAEGQLSPVPQLLSPHSRAHARPQEKPLQREACTPQQRVAPAHN